MTERAMTDRKKKRPFTGAQGLRLPRSGVRALKEAGIYANPILQVVHQDLRDRWVLRGLESGGSFGNFGRYITFANDQGEPLEFLQPVEAFGVNGIHAVVVAESIVRVDMVRNGRSYDLLITQHSAGAAFHGARPPLHTRILFHGHRGRIELDLAGKDKMKAGSVEPQFLSLSLEPVSYPPHFRSVVLSVTKAVNCLKCLHSHYVRAPKTQPNETPKSNIEVAL
ncbi:MAG TPA: hypothetical protein VKZ53_23855 [Candidatus Angelobacter sp.]|nr:hypothetical protein [Candidatus Angelobacter sp.]